MSIRGVTEAPIHLQEPIESEYTLQAGDTLEAVAVKFGMTQEELLNMNPQIRRQADIQPGVVLKLGMKTVEVPLRKNLEDLIEQAAPPSEFDRIQAQGAKGQGLELNVKLMADQFEFNQDGNLVIKNQQLSNFVKAFLLQPPSEAFKPSESLMHKEPSALGGSLEETAQKYAEVPMNMGGEGMDKDHKMPTALLEDAQFARIAPEDVMQKIAEAPAFKVPVGEATAHKAPPLSFSWTEIERAALPFQDVAYEPIPLPEPTGDVANLPGPLPEPLERRVEVMLNPDDFALDAEGNLLIKNNELAVSLQKLFEKTPPEEARFIRFGTAFDTEK